MYATPTEIYIPSHYWVTDLSRNGKDIHTWYEGEGEEKHNSSQDCFCKPVLEKQLHVSKIGNLGVERNVYIHQNKMGVKAPKISG